MNMMRSRPLCRGTDRCMKRGIECRVGDGTLAIHDLLWAISIARRRCRPGRRSRVLPGQAGHWLLSFFLLVSRPVIITTIVSVTSLFL